MRIKAMSLVFLLALPGYLFVTAVASACPPPYIPQLNPLDSRALAKPLHLPDRVNKPVGFCGRPNPETLQPVDSSVFSEVNGGIFVPIFLLALLLTLLISIIIERTLFFISARKHSDEFVVQFNGALRSNQSLEAFGLAVDYRNTQIGKVTLKIWRATERLSLSQPAGYERCFMAYRQSIAQSDRELQQGLRGLRIIFWLALLFGVFGTAVNLLPSEHQILQNLTADDLSYAFQSLLLGILIAVIARLADKRFARMSRQLSVEIYRLSWETFAGYLRHGIQHSVVASATVHLVFDY